MAVFRVQISPAAEGPGQRCDHGLVAQLREAGLPDVEGVIAGRLFFLEGRLTREQAERIASVLLNDPVAERWELAAADDEVRSPELGSAVEIHLRPGVMDPVAETTLAELRAAGYPVDAVRTARHYVMWGRLSQADLLATVRRVLANDCIEQVVAGTAGVRPSPKPPVFEFKLRRVAIRALDEAGLRALARDGHLFLSLEEMRAIQAYYRRLGRDPTDLELEMLAQTWSEHCVHKTLKSAIVYRGAPMPVVAGGRGRLKGMQPRQHGSDSRVEIRYDSLLKDTIVRVTEELIAEKRGPQCLSVFKDNAGVIAFDDRFGIAFKVETHNHPSAIEPYGGAATGVGGCVRDVVGCGLGARPIANTDVFCFAPPDWPHDRLPSGVLHPRRVLCGVVKGVADYGNRMGIPTVNGAIYFDPRFLGNPLVYCGCVGLIPRQLIEKAARPGDLIVLVGGRTGRDGIHGATFSSAELTDTHADEFSHAVQIGNAITEKRFLDAILRARDDASGCLYTAITDCGAGGLSSAVGEMGEAVGGVVDLDRVPLKYAGLRYDEIWISEAQERMVLAVPPKNIDALMEIMRHEEVEATVIGTFGSDRTDERPPRLVVRYCGAVVGELEMQFLHHGLPKRERVAEWSPNAEQARGDEGTQARSGPAPVEWLGRLKRLLQSPTIAGKQWVIRQYDHEVQGGSVVKPLCGPGSGPSDAAVLRPRLDSPRGVAIACGLAPHLTDVDPYWMAVASIDEALRNVVCVGGDPGRTAVLDNFCWGAADDPRQLGALVRACQGCYDAAKVYGVPFISGKDSLNNEFALDAGDVDGLLETLRRFTGDGELAGVFSQQAIEDACARVRQTRRLSIPGTLLISAVSVIEDVRGCVTADLKIAGSELFLVGGLPTLNFSMPAAYNVHRTVAEANKRDLVRACHDSAEGGWLVTVAEMALAANLGVDVGAPGPDVPGPFDECCAGYVVETSDADELERLSRRAGVPITRLGRVRADQSFRVADQATTVAELHSAWTTRHG
jgi:phosphoribosylformylglycinamidine synthase